MPGPMGSLGTLGLPPKAPTHCRPRRHSVGRHQPSTPPFSQPKLMVTLDEDRGAELVVSPYDRDISWGEIQKDYSGWMLDEGLLDLYHYFLDAALERLLGDW